MRFFYTSKSQDIGKSGSPPNFAVLREHYANDTIRIFFYMFVDIVFCRAND